MSQLALTSIGTDKFNPNPSDGVVLFIGEGWEHRSFSQAWQDAMQLLIAEQTGKNSVTIACGETWFTLNKNLDSLSYALLDQSQMKQDQFERLIFECSNSTDEEIIESISKAARALHTKIMPEGSTWSGVTLAEPRPWINPSEPYDRNLPRRAVCKIGDISLFLTESFTPAPPIPQPFASELLLFGADSANELLENLRMIRDLFERHPEKSISDLAYTLNVLYPPFACKWRASLICENAKQMSQSLITLILKLESGEEFYSDPYDGIFLANNQTAINGKMAFVLPGLGSAYTNMLKDLSMHFPLVREVFDYIDLVTQNAGSSDIPSLRIYPLAKGMSDSSSLISADYAVLAVLMAEFSLFRLFTSLGITPDAFMGFSTGEFGVYVMNGSADVTKAASIFYEQSTHVHRSFPKKEKEGLKTVSMFTKRDTVEKLALAAGLTVHLTADLTDKHVIITGKNAEIEKLLEILEQESIGFSVAPVAIPYHTDLVSQAVDETRLRSSFESCDFTNAEVESWLCSLEGKGPSKPAEIQEALIGLLRRPISFRNTMKSMFESGITTFVELGPQGILTYQTKEILSGKKHLSIASNLAGKPGITQINAMLAELFAHGYGANFDLAQLYTGRAARSVFEPSETIAFDCFSDKAPPQDQLVTEFLSNTTRLHDQFNQANLEILQAYLQSLTDNKVPVIFLKTDASINDNAVVAFSDQFADLALNADESWLSAAELADYEKNCRHEERKKSWLLGRLAAKYAIQELFLKFNTQQLSLSQIEIFNTKNGAPYCKLDQLPIPLISIAHSQNAACAVAVRPESALTPGIDVEWLEQTKLSDELIAKFGKGDQEKYAALKYWTKREAGFKSFTKVSDSPFEATYFELNNYLIALVLQPLTARLDGAKIRE